MNILDFVKCSDKFTYNNLLLGFKMIILASTVILESQVIWSVVAFTSSRRFIFWVFKFLVASVSKSSETVTSQHRDCFIADEDVDNSRLMMYIHYFQMHE